MAIPRSIQVNRANPSWVHCTARCGRQAYLAGEGFDHRRGWVERRLQFLTGIFGCEVAAFAVMTDHFHVVLRMAPEDVDRCSDEEVVRRWLRAYPGHRDEADVAEASSVDVEEWKVTKHAADATWVADRRQRLSSLSWFMRSLSEPIGRRANLEDGCHGRFWEGRFHSTPLLDEAGLLACMVYVDLNPIRAQRATSIAESVATSAHLRLSWAQSSGPATRPKKARKESRARSQNSNKATSDQATNSDAVEPPWLASLLRLAVRSSDGRVALDPLQYLQLVETTGRLVGNDHGGAISDDLPKLLERIDPDIQPVTWLRTMSGWRQMSAGSVGRRENLDREAERRGHRRARTRCDLFRRRPAVDDRSVG